MSVPWLPAEILYSSFGGDWDRFINAVYAQFKFDFLDELDRGQLSFNGLPLRLRKHPLVNGKEASFWHLISSGEIEDERLADFDRCECIGWAKAIIANCTDPAIKMWENTRGTNTNVCLWFEAENYLVVLGKRSGYYILLTAYFVQDYKKRKLFAEYAAFHTL
jgi:hypothetical protein